MASYKYSKRADSDLDGIAEYTFLRYGENQARKYRKSIDRAAEMLSEFPLMGHPYTTKSGMVYQKFNVGEHAIFYRPTDNGILIVRVLHLKMRFEKHLN